MAFEFPETIHGLAISQLAFDSEAILSYCDRFKIPCNPICEAGECISLFFPTKEYLLVKYGPEQGFSCWISKDVSEQIERNLKEV